MRIIALLKSPAPLGGICPACDRPMDEGGCLIGEMNSVTREDARSRTGISRVVEVFCEGTPTHPVVDCPACQ
jgi:hypothetical protein